MGCKFRLIFFLSIAAFLILTGICYALVLDNEVTSSKIREADNRPTQNTNTGSGVKTGHIQNGAVTNPKLANNSISSIKLQAGSVTSDKLSFYRNILIVAPSGGRYSSPVTALNSITNASATNPYLVKIMPGVYDIGAGTLQMKPYVDVEGSGENVTLIQGNIDSQNAGIVNGASDSEVRFLTVKNYGTGNSSIGIYNNAGLVLTHMHVEVTGGMNAIGIYNQTVPVVSNMRMHSINITISGGSTCYGIYNDSAFHRFSDSSISVNCHNAVNYGVYNKNSAPFFKRDSLAGRNGAINYALYNESGAPVIEQSVTEGSILSAAGTIYVGDTRLNTPVIPGSGMLKCFSVYNRAFDPLGTSCE